MIVEDTRALFILEKSKFSRFLKIFQEKDWPKIIVFSLFLVIAFILAVATYFFSKAGFVFLEKYPQFLESMLFYTLLACFFLIFLLTLGSSLISALQVFFVQDDDHFLLSSPIRPQIIFESRFLNLLIFSSWPAFVFGIPLLLAFKKTFQFSFLYFLLSFLVLVLILLISIVSASILALMITSFFSQQGRKFLNLSGLISLPILAWWASAVLIPPGLVQAFQKLRLDQIDRFLRSLPINSPVFPSTWAVNFIFYWTLDQKLALFNLFKIMIVLTGLTTLVYWLVNKEYFFALSKARRGRFVAGPHDIIRPKMEKEPRPFSFSGIKAVFFKKDLLIFSRSQAEILQAGFIGFMIILYFLILSKVPLEKLGEVLPYLSVSRLMRMNFVFGGYILTLLSLRFVFPQFSAEGQVGWLIWSAPFSKKEIFWEKLLAGWGFLGVIGALISLLSTLILKLSFQFLLIQFFVFLALSLGLASINLGMGALFPDFEEKNLEKISTSSGGILATGLSLFYIFIVSMILFPQLNIFSLNFVIVLLISILLTVFFWPISLIKIDKYQF